MIKEAGWNFDNSYAQLPNTFFTRLHPTPVKTPNIIKLNRSLAKDLGLSVEFLESKEGIEILSGNRIPEGSVPLAQAYAGHQYGYFTMLGDGRAHLLGEQITPLGERFDIQLKGSGITPYSRRGDGRAALGPMLREYIISEAMYGLGIPTTRSLAVVTTGEAVYRETILPGAILTRVASSHIRIGTFQYIANWGNKEELKIFADYTIQRHFNKVSTRENPYLYFLREVIRRQAKLIAQWQLVGFVHGVMNTDNMVLSGETIDYGPCAFMDTYDPFTVFSSIDTHGRYAYRKQPFIAIWNLNRFAETLLPLLHADMEMAIQMVQDEISQFHSLFQDYWLSGMRAKLGLFHEQSEDELLVNELLNVMHKYRADYTNTFRALTMDQFDDSELYGTEEFTQWYKKWKARLCRQEEGPDKVYELMRRSNPAVIPRNHRVEEALEAAVTLQDYSIMENLIDVLANPYAYNTQQIEYTKLSPSANRPYRTFCGT